MSYATLIVNPNNRLKSSLAGIEPPLWASLITTYQGADILDAEALDLNLDQTEQVVNELLPDTVIIVVMGNNPSVSSTPKMPIAEALAKRLDKYNVWLTGIHPIAAGASFPVMITPFEGTPDIRWDKLPMNLYRAHNWHCLDGTPRSPYASIYTSLNCPYDCFYCNIHTLYNDRQVRYRPIENIARDIDILTSIYKVRNIKIWDELFTLKESRVLEICDVFQRYDLNIWAYARIDTVTPVMLKAMKRAGINWLAYGFENLKDPKVITNADEVIETTRAAGINIIANFMFGLPAATLEDDRRILNYAKEHLFEFVNFYDARPYPGSKWWELTHESSGPIEYDQYKYMSDFRILAFNEYFNNPHYVNMIQSKFGNQAVSQIANMLSERFSWDNSLIRS